MSTSPLAPSSGPDHVQTQRFADELMRRGVRPDLVIHYVRWVQEWLEIAPGLPPAKHPASAFASFLGQRGLPEWQCRQGFQAVRVWSELFPVVPDMASPTDLGPPPAWEPLLCTMRRRLQETNYSPRTIGSYLDWARRFADHAPQVPTDSIGLSMELGSFLGRLTTGRNLSPASVAQARNALAYLAKKVLFLSFELDSKGSAHHSKRLPRVISPQQVGRLLDHCTGPWSLMFRLQYGCGLRLAELLDLRVQDLDLDRSVLVVRKGKGDKDRRLPVPHSLRSDLQTHLLSRHELWLQDLQDNCATVDLPHALARKFPKLASSLEWQYLFPSPKPLQHPVSSRLVRWHPLEGTARAALKRAAESAGIDGRVHPHLLRHCYATHLLESSMPLREIQDLLGHARIETTMIYLHVRASLPQLRSPLDSLPASLSATPLQAAAA